MKIHRKEFLFYLIEKDINNILLNDTYFKSSGYIFGIKITDRMKNLIANIGVWFLNKIYSLNNGRFLVVEIYSLLLKQKFMDYGWGNPTSTW